MDSTRRYLAFIAYELYIAAMCCVSTIVFLSLSPLSFTAFYSMLFVEKRSDVLLCFLCFHLFLLYLFRIDDEDSLKEKDQSNSSPPSPEHCRPLSFLSPPPLPPLKMKDCKFIREGEDYVRMASELSHSSDSDTSDINVRSDRFIAENKKRFRDEIREDQLRFFNRKMAK